MRPSARRRLDIRGEGAALARGHAEGDGARRATRSVPSSSLAIVLTLSIVLSLLGVGRCIGPAGLDIGALATFCFIWGMGGATLAGRENMLGALRRLIANRDMVDTQHQSLATLKINGARGWMVFFSTHPPLEACIAALNVGR